MGWKTDLGGIKEGLDGDGRKWASCGSIPGVILYLLMDTHEQDHKDDRFL